MTAKTSPRPAKTRTKRRANDFAAVLAALAQAPDVSRGRMFGSEGLKVAGKVFSMEVKGHLVVKLSPARAQELSGTGKAAPFDPGHGRLMKQWISVPATAGLDWVALSREALLFARA